jgi:hypothetical protein
MSSRGRPLRHGKLYRSVTVSKALAKVSVISVRGLSRKLVQYAVRTEMADENSIALHNGGPTNDLCDHSEALHLKTESTAGHFTFFCYKGLIYFPELRVNNGGLFCNKLKEKTLRRDLGMKVEE